jgi:hypothetical protein
VLFKGSAQLAALPPYLTVQMVRFFYKTDVGQKAKILRKVRLNRTVTKDKMLITLFYCSKCTCARRMWARRPRSCAR